VAKGREILVSKKTSKESNAKAKGEKKGRKKHERGERIVRSGYLRGGIVKRRKGGLRGTREEKKGAVEDGAC